MELFTLIWSIYTTASACASVDPAQHYKNVYIIIRPHRSSTYLDAAYCLWSPYVIGRPYIFSSCDFYLYGRLM